MRLTPRVAGFRSEYPAGFKLECMAGFVGTRTRCGRGFFRGHRITARWSLKILDILMRTVPISRFVDPSIPSGGLNTTLVAVVTDVVRSGKPIVGFGFSSIGRFGQQGLIEERFAPRLRDAAFVDFANETGKNIDPFRAWNVMMKGEKPGGHGERCVAVGTLDMALWDIAAKIADVPLYHHIATHGPKTPVEDVAAYVGGGYYYPHDDVGRLADEASKVKDLGYTHFKLKIGNLPIAQDLRRVEAVSKVMPDSRNVAVDAMNSYGRGRALEAAAALSPFGLWWFEDICDPLDFATLAEVVQIRRRCRGGGSSIFGGRSQAIGDPRRHPQRKRHPAFRSGPLLWTAGLPADCKRIRTARVGAQQVLASWRPSVHLASCSGLGAWWDRGQSPLLPTVRRAVG